ncbi:MAG TPA: hypothetical protein DD401_07175 [Prevotella sp.]|nr:hypothetical protein [Prevotella sp.]
MRNRVVNVYPYFRNQGGAQNVVLQLAENLNADFPTVLISSPAKDVPDGYRNRAEYKRLSLATVRRLADGSTVFISHHRKTTLILILYQILLLRKLPVIHVAHSTFANLRWITLFPRKCVAISQTVKHNMIDYFKVPEKNITVIYNGVRDLASREILSVQDVGQINILFAGRLCKLKRQVLMAEYLQDKLPPHIHLFFAGEGEDKEALVKATGDNKQMHYLGQIDIRKEIGKFHYAMLFSEKEGLPLTLLESCMYGRPMLTNDIPAAIEINKNGKTGFVYRSIKAFAEALGKLPFPGTAEYKALSENARKEYEDRFREETMIEKYKTLMLQLQ